MLNDLASKDDEEGDAVCNQLLRAYHVTANITAFHQEMVETFGLCELWCMSKGTWDGLLALAQVSTRLQVLVDKLCRPLLKEAAAAAANFPPEGEASMSGGYLVEWGAIF
eukprot:3827298-Amphidinium_carterae.1